MWQQRLWTGLSAASQGIYLATTSCVWTISQKGIFQVLWLAAEQVWYFMCHSCAERARWARLPIIPGCCAPPRRRRDASGAIVRGFFCHSISKDVLMNYAVYVLPCICGNAESYIYKCVYSYSYIVWRLNLRAYKSHCVVAQIVA